MMVVVSNRARPKSKGLLPGSGAKPKPQFDHGIRSGQRLVRSDYTISPYDALGAMELARMLQARHEPESVCLRQAKGVVVEVASQFSHLTAEGTACAIDKDGGDDIDPTTGPSGIAAVTLLPGAPRAIPIVRGTGVGRVSKTRPYTARRRGEPLTVWRGR